MILVNFEKRLPALQVRAAFMVQGGRTIVLWGDSGAGKTTILDCIAGLATPDRGEIILEGSPLFSSTKRVDLPSRRRGVGYVFQGYALFPHMTALQNVAFALDRPERDTAMKLLVRFDLRHCAGRRPGTMSGGERQRLAFARVLAMKPRLLLLDEPWSALDRKARTDMRREFMAWRSSVEAPVILVTHDRDEAERLGDDIHEVRDGEVML